MAEKWKTVVISRNQYKVLLIMVLITLFMGQSCTGTVPATPSLVAASATETITLTATTVPLPTSTEAAASSTPLAIAEISNDQLDLSQMSVDEWASTSPNGKWVAVGLVAFPKENIGGQLAYVRLMIFSADGTTHWTIIDKQKEMDLGFPVPVPLKWSRDGSHFYFTHRVTPDGCSAFPFLTDLQQVNLEDGTVDNLLPDSAVALALSPDDSQVAYFFGGERGLVLRDLVTGEERETRIDPGKDFNAGNILWSPEGNSLALTLAINPCTGRYGLSKTVWAESTTILLVDVETLQQKVLVNEDPRWFVTWEWNEPERITVANGEEDSLWYLNVNTGEITRE